MEFRFKIDDLFSKEKSTVVKQELVSLKKVMKVEPDGAANGSQPVRSETNRTSSENEPR